MFGPRTVGDGIFSVLNQRKWKKPSRESKTVSTKQKKELENDSAPRTYKSFEDVVKEILGDDYDENWYPEEERERDRRNLAIASYKCCKEYERILKGEVQV